MESGENFYHESTPGVFTKRARKTNMSWLMIRSMKGVRRASRVESTDNWYSNGAKNLFGLDGA